jgi:8-oxo-dGTP pyrophosphatase MutT (NUDIX family)
MKAPKPAKRHKKAASRQQVAALPWRFAERLEIMLVSSRETRRWIIPKGWPMAGRSAAAAAAIEALEEAGLLGEIAAQPFGHYAYEKNLSRGQSVLCRVDVFQLRVVRQREDWPEKEQRDTRWFSAEEAMSLVSDPGLAELIRQFIQARDR